MRQVITIIIFLTLVLLINMGASPAASGEAESSDILRTLQSDIQALQEGQQAIQEDLKAIKDLLKTGRRQGQPVQDVNVTLNVTDNPAKGNSEARVTLLEFTDYQCPYCARHALSVFPQIQQAYIDTGKIQYVLRDFPIASLHAYAEKAHEAAHCAGEQGKYWEMHDQLFANQKALQPEHLADYAQKAGISEMGVFQNCMENGRFHKLIQQSITEGAQAGVRGTPSFLLGLSDKEGNVKVVKLIRGAQSYSLFQEQIKKLLLTNK